jgi:hypothetical protein
LRFRALSCQQALLRLSVLVVLADERPEIVDLFLVLDAGECHSGAGNLRLGILDVILELRFVPGDAGILVGVRIGITRRGTGLALKDFPEFFQPVIEWPGQRTLENTGGGPGALPGSHGADFRRARGPRLRRM